MVHLLVPPKVCKKNACMLRAYSATKAVSRGGTSILGGRTSNTELFKAEYLLNVVSTVLLTGVLLL